MYGLLFGLTGLALGTVAGIVIGARYVRAEALQAQIDETQARMLTLLHEMRSTLDETRGHVQAAWSSATGQTREAGATGDSGDGAPREAAGGALDGGPAPGVEGRA